MKSTIATLALALTVATATAETTFCGQYDSADQGKNYYVINNLWGESYASSGSECTTLKGASGDGVSWSTQWMWAGGDGYVKSYPHASLVYTPKLLSAISTMPSTFDWSYSTSNIKADVAYDLFTSSSSNSQATDGEYELMVWLASYGDISPITETSSPIATTKIGSYSWKVYFGYNGSMKVYSFVAVNAPLQSYSGDIREFYTYLTNHQGFPAGSQYLNTFQGGTEPFTGSATLTVSKWSAAVK
ncbi:concanavalin A-like lectin/glucanase domain-containing protein [Xylariales sp. AK1849]|nr:concanavalin A-like lectin/glucanase domain-containing protein [Xylariales sp. AK1849]